MTAIAPAIESASSLAERLAASNFAANAEALHISQPHIIESLPDLPGGLSFVFGRDGTLTAMTRDGAWWQGCSLPRRAAMANLKTLDSVGRVSCYLAPSHAAQVRVALDKLQAEQAVVALCPEGQTLAVMLHCENFSADIAAHRLFFAGGTSWEEPLAGIFEQYPGLPTPEQFIRGAAADHELTNALIPPAQKIFAAVTSQRTAKINALRESWSPAARIRPRICLIAPSHFRLWDDGGEVLNQIFAKVDGKACDLVRFDTDDPTSAAPMALAELAGGCDAVVSLNVVRADLPEVLSPQIPWITWLVREHVPATTSSGERDALLVADPRLRTEAVAKGWSAGRVETAAWPAAELPAATNALKRLSLIVDTRTIEAPSRIKDMSSQRLLWEAAAEEVAADPFVATPDPAKYLRRRQRELQIPDDGFDVPFFLSFLIAPAFAQGLARLMLREKLPLCVAGAGWESLPEFESIYAGPITSRVALGEAVQSSQALVYAWPSPATHPMDALQRPVLRPATGRSQFLASAKSAVQGRLQPVPPPQITLNAEMFLRLLKK